MEKYLVTIEFRYSDAPKRYEEHTQRISKRITIGIYDTFEKACENGNTLLEKLENKFALHVFPNGRVAEKERFSKNGGCFGTKKNLVTNLAYLKTSFQFFAKITTLKIDPIEDTINDVLEAVKRYREFKSK